mgnify:CR=1 FL=1|tara:strand:- start:46 stop:435 length:390 start_codon:yes stop_codon:yes gene_type:complete
MDNQNFRHIEILANDINEELQKKNQDTNNNVNKRSVNNFDNNVDKHNFNEEIIEDTNEEVNNIPRTICEPILLLSIYFILSQKNIQLSLQRYLPILKPNDNGNFQQLSIIIYGLILTLFFYSMKNLLEL